MSQTPLSAVGTTSTLREACADLIRRLRTGDEARVEHYFDAFPALAADPDAALELIYTEYATREELGRSPQDADYLRRFPQWSAALERQFDIHRLLASDEPLGATGARPLDDAAAATKGPERCGAYEIVRALGRGGMGTVYLATHVELGRLAAVKILHGAGSTGAALAERFRTEVRSAAALGHPQIVQLYELGETPDGRLFAAFEYVEGGSLVAALGGRPRPAREAAELIRLLAAALDCAHRAGIVHCDLTPANILLARDGTPKIADFGLARLPRSAAALDEKPKAATTLAEHDFAHDADYEALSSVALAGTPGYLAPERIEQPGIATPAADIYGLGAIFYELLTGRPPHVGATPLETLRQARDYDPPSPRELVPNLPRDSATICLKCLERDPARRYRDAAGLAEDLRRFLAGEPILARPVGSLERAWKWAGRHQGWATAIVATTAALAILAVGGTRYNVRLREALNRTETQEQQIRGQAEQLADRLDSLNRSVYTMQLNQAEALVERAPHQSLQLLRDEARCPPELRDFAWGMLVRRASQERRTLLGHAAPVWCVAERGDGKLVTAALDDTVRVWSAADGATANGMPSVVPVTTAGATLLALSPDGSRLAAAYDDRSLRVWNFAALATPRDLVGHAEAAVALVFFADGRWLASAADDGTLRIWDPAGNAIAEWSVAGAGEILSLAASPDDKTLAVGLSDGRIKLIDSIDLGGSAARSVALSRDGRRLAYATNEQVLTVLDLESGNATAEYRGHTERIGALRFTDDGKAIVSAADDRTVKLWDVPGERVPRLVDGDDLKTLTVTFSHDGKFTAVAGYEGVIRVSGFDDELAGRKPKLLVGHAAAVRALCFLPEDRQLLSCGEDNTIRLWDLATAKTVRVWQQPAWVMDIALARDGRRCYTADADGKVRSFAPADAATGATTTQLDFQAHAASINALALSQNSSPLLATASRDGTVKLWDAATGAPRATLSGHERHVLALDFSPDGKTLAAGDDAGCLILWDVATARPRHTLRGHAQGIYDVAFSPDGRVVASASGGRWVQAGGEVKLWDVVGGQVHATLDGYASPLAFRADGLMLAAGFEPRRKIGLWSAVPYEKRPVSPAK
ncbi:MAG: protein kinase [Planctomycetia bacterium]|nr:protein kinase [Planctomycetia bacterium]